MTQLNVGNISKGEFEETVISIVYAGQISSLTSNNLKSKVLSMVFVCDMRLLSAILQTKHDFVIKFSCLFYGVCV